MTTTCQPQPVYFNSIMRADNDRRQNFGLLEVLDPVLQVVMAVKQIYIPVNVDPIVSILAFP